MCGAGRSDTRGVLYDFFLEPCGGSCIPLQRATHDWCQMYMLEYLESEVELLDT